MDELGPTDSSSWVAQGSLASFIFDYLRESFPRAVIYMGADPRGDTPDKFYVNHVFIGRARGNEFFPASKGHIFLVKDPIQAANPALFKRIHKLVRELTGL